MLSKAFMSTKKNFLRDRNINIFIDNYPEWGGTYQYTKILLDALSIKKNFNKKNLKVFFTKKKWKNKLKDFNSEFINLKKIEKLILIFLIIFNLKNIFFFLKKKNLTSLPSEFFDKKTTWFFPSQDLLSVLCEGQSIVSIHDLMHRYSSFPEVSSFFRKFYREILFKNITRYASKILVDSNLGKKHVYESYKRKKKVYVQYFATSHLKVKNVKKIQNSLYYPSQFWPHKNHAKLIFAMQVIKKKIPNIKLFLSGHKLHKYKKLRSLVEKLDLSKNIKFLGYVTEYSKVKKIQEVSALINPSLLGPTNLPQLEAFNYSCPVVISNIFAAKEQCKNAAIYFNPHSPKSIANAVCNLFQNQKLRNNIIKNGKILKKKYSLTNFSINLFNVIVS
jgi:glycosyltransferase involved in cell wall biosynthesis